MSGKKRGNYTKAMLKSSGTCKNAKPDLPAPKRRIRATGVLGKKKIPNGMTQTYNKVPGHALRNNPK